MLNFLDLQNEVKRRGTKNQSGTQFDTAVKNLLNSSLFRVSRDGLWRVMRRRRFFNTKTTYSTGSGAATLTNNSTVFTVTGATFITDDIEVGRRIKFSGDSRYHTIRTLSSETAGTIEETYNGTSTSTGTYSILGQEEYNLPLQAGHRLFMWHEEYGYPYKMQYITDQEFFLSGSINTTESTPTHYRMWGEDMVKTQLRNDSALKVYSSSDSDTSVDIVIFGEVSDLPDQETIATNSSDGTTIVTGSKTFKARSIERVVKDSSTVGRITVTDADGNVIVVLPAGDATSGVVYRKVQLYPLPDTAFDINVQYYKDPYRLVNDDDVHEMGQEFDEAIILLATAKIMYESSKNAGDRFMGLYKDELKSLRKANTDKIDFFPTLKRGLRANASGARVHPRLGYHQVGAYYGPKVI